MKKETALIFDLDGVLVNTVEAHFFGWRAVSQELGIPFTREDNEKFRGISRIKVISQLTRAANVELDDDDMNRLMDMKVKLYRKYVRQNSEKIQVTGVPGLLEALKDDGYKISLASASKNASFLMDIAKIESYFDVISDGHFPGKHKPEPEQLLSIASQLKAKPCNCIVVEDSLVGLQAAGKAGMSTIAIGKYTYDFNGYNLHYHSLKSIDCRKFIENIKKIANR